MHSSKVRAHQNPRTLRNELNEQPQQQTLANRGLLPQPFKACILRSIQRDLLPDLEELLARQDLIRIGRAMVQFAEDGEAFIAAVFEDQPSRGLGQPG